MAAPVVARSTRRVPPRGAVVDRSHPFARGLEFCFIPALGTIDLAHGYVGTRSGTPRADVRAYGPASAMTSATSDYYSFAGVPDAPFLNEFTVFFIVRKTIGTNYSMIASKCLTSGGVTAPFDIYIGNTNPERVNMIRSSDTATKGNWTYTATNSITNATDYVVSLSSHPTQATGTGFVNGTYSYANAYNGVGYAPSGAGKPLLIGRRDDGLATDCVITMVAMWSRMMSNGEHQQLYADPFCFLRW